MILGRYWPCWPPDIRRPCILHFSGLVSFRTTPHACTALRSRPRWKPSLFYDTLHARLHKCCSTLRNNHPRLRTIEKLLEKKQFTALSTSKWMEPSAYVSGVFCWVFWSHNILLAWEKKKKQHKTKNWNEDDWWCPKTGLNTQMFGEVMLNVLRCQLTY